MKNRTILNWSGGKDAAMAYYILLKSDIYEIESLLTTISDETNRVTMHGVPQSLIEKQSKNMSLEIDFIRLPTNTNLTSYNKVMESHGLTNVTKGISHYAFGDINLEDLRAYRNQELSKVNITTHYPLWGKDTKDLALEFIETGFKAIVVAINGSLLDESFAGREYNQSFLNDLPKDVDWCGENGEFHTFVYDGPIFKEPIPFTKGNIEFHKYSSSKGEDCFCNEDEQKDWDIGFWFCDLK